MLVDVPLPKMRELCTILEKEWYLAMRAINLLKRWILWNEEGKICPDVSLLYSRDNENSGVFCTIEKGLRGLYIAVFALDGFEEILKTELMNWNVWAADKLVLMYILEKHVPLIEEILKIKNHTITVAENYKSYSIPLENALNFNTSCPENVEFGPLSVNNLDEIYKTWLKRDNFGMEVLNEWFQFNGKYACGIFCKTTGAILSSCQLSHDGWISSVYTQESARRKGYAELLIKNLSEMMADDSVEVCLFISNTNLPSLNLFGKMGFEHRHDFSVIYSEKNAK